MSVKLGFDPFATVLEAFGNLYPDAACEVWFEETPKCLSCGGFAMVKPGAPSVVVIDMNASVVEATEALAHELAHVVAVGDAHGPVWAAAFDAITKEYARLVGDDQPNFSSGLADKLGKSDEAEPQSYEEWLRELAEAEGFDLIPKAA
jgi:hypothetical protein